MPSISCCLTALALLLGTPHLQAQPVHIGPVYSSGFESGEVGFKPIFSAVNEGNFNATTHPEPLTLYFSEPVQAQTFVTISSSDPLRLEVAGGGVAIPQGQSSAVVMVNAYLAGAAPVVLTAHLSGSPMVGVRVEWNLNETDSADELDFCSTAFPPSFSVAAGAITPALYGRVFDAGITEFAGPPGGWLVGAGYGPAGTDPRLLADWHFKAASYNLQAGNDDEYVANIPAPSDSGVYSYVYRMSKDGGGGWTYCDLDGAGSNPGLDFSLDQMGTMYVYGDDVRNETDTDEEADFCVLQFPSNLLVNAGASTNPVFIRLYEAGVTEAEGAPPGWIAQAGFGPLASDPRVPFEWTFFNATFNAQFGNDDEFSTTMQAPNDPGDYAYVGRVSQDSGSTWTYCDLNGAGSSPGLSFSPSQLGLMTVQFPPP